MIIPALYERQKKRGGYLTSADMHNVADELGVPLHRVNSLVTFFPHFRTDPPPKVTVHVCRDMSCHLHGGVELKDKLTQWATQTHQQNVEVCGVSCLGRCDRAVAAMVNDNLVAATDLDRLKRVVDDLMDDRTPSYDSDAELVTPKVGKWDMDVYGGEGRYDQVKNFLTSGSDPDQVLAALENAGLLGMGGAGGRAYLKWGDVMRAEGTSGEKFIVCNADESEPGTFKDREILLAAPHLTIEGMIVAALVVGATRGWIYVRHEYPEQIEKCREEIRRAVGLRALGKNIFGSSRSFELDVFPSPGGYICGEQTALIEAMEDKRAEPRNRPPELMTNGLYNQPTLLSNVETFAWVPAILKDGGDWFSAQGQNTGTFTAGSSERMKGKRLFSISGDLVKPGVYEVPTGITLGELIDNHCGGMKDGKAIVAVAMSGPSGGLLPGKIPVKYLSRRFVEKNVPESITEIDIRDLPLDINVSRAVGYMLGAGIVVYGEGCDVLAEAVANSRFYKNESCGKCVPCRIGSQKVTEMGERLLANEVTKEEFATFEPVALQLSEVMQATSICGLGQVASNPMQTFLKYFPDLAQKACVGSNKQSDSDGESKR
ncbi:NADH-quinone oxidoreductase subunit 1 [Rubripirellula obstinata]|uniref:NADH-quinone oxidoreductase subunit 1 n=1 Tax=Rubripirellula obstinata TaxID=406547 RepID=A0A5B1CP58_9BACT|nr:NAD(P)H-dependent oxidoreductase subunit E [Rubripirellula obstinata]KAA1261735.1 NADH-quinone oxidoreductase subunit 1 [Rubripirellula obstinata]